MTSTVHLLPCATVADWAAMQARLRHETLEQSWAYGEAVAAVSRTQPERWLIQDPAKAEPIGLVQAFRRCFGALGSLVRVVRGPLFQPGLPRATRLAALQAIRTQYSWRNGRCLLWWLPEMAGGSDAEGLMGELGMNQMMTGWSSVRLDLSAPPATLRSRLDGKWRNALKAAERSPILIDDAWDETTFTAVMRAHDVQRIEKRFLGPDGAFYRAFAQAAAQAGGTCGESAHLYTAKIGNRPVSGMLLLRHGRGATYAAGWSGEAGRLVRAHHRLLWHGLLALKAQGVAHFDLGGANTEEGAGVARFKLGLNGEVFTLAGSFL
jgi:hypothetical protein